MAHADEGLGQIVVQPPTLSESKQDYEGSAATKAFTFDAVFGPAATQRQIYDACAARVVESVLEGYNGTIFAYGQVGRDVTYVLSFTGPELACAGFLS